MKFLLPGLLLLLSTACFAQYADTTATMKANEYLEKSNRQKKAGWILFGSGAVLASTGIIVTATSGLGILIEGDGSSTVGTILMYTGLAGMAGSIPFFLAAGKNRRKAAASISFKMEKTTLINSWVSSSRPYPVVAIRVHLR